MNFIWLPTFNIQIQIQILRELHFRQAALSDAGGNIDKNISKLIECNRAQSKAEGSVEQVLSGLLTNFNFWSTFG